MAPTLGYFGIRGLGEPIRLLHALLSVPLEEVTYGESHSLSQWKDHREALQTPFPNLPYYVGEDGVTRCESAHILRHVERTYAITTLIDGKEEDDDPLKEQCFFFLMSCHHTLRTCCYGYLPQSTTRAKKYETGITGEVRLVPSDVDDLRKMVSDQIVQCLGTTNSEGKGGPWMAGMERPGVCDVLMYTLIEMAECVHLDRYDGPWANFVVCFEALPTVASYLSRRPKRLQHAPFARLNA